MSPSELSQTPQQVGLVVGFVVIGRNEGARLDQALRSIPPGVPVVYVDSGSTDSSVTVARALEADVVELDLTIPFTAARARNAGASRLVTIRPDLDWAMFMDGDCELVDGWIAGALHAANGHPSHAVFTGRRLERHPNRSVYNKLCDDEWDTPIGEAKACGGDALIRLAAFHSVGGFRDDLIAGEEPELCIRLRRSGWGVMRLDLDMTIHDAAMTRFVHWWRRARRSGHAFAEGAALHGAPPERHWVRETRRAVAWGIGLPAAVAVACLAIGPVALLGLLAYPAQAVRIGLREPRAGAFRWQRAFFLVLARFPEALGVLRFEAGRLLRRPSAIMEHK